MGSDADGQYAWRSAHICRACTLISMVDFISMKACLTATARRKTTSPPLSHTNWCIRVCPQSWWQISTASPEQNVISLQVSVRSIRNCGRNSDHAFDAALSHQRAAHAIKNGFFASQIVPVDVQIKV